VLCLTRHCWVNKSGSRWPSSDCSSLVCLTTALLRLGTYKPISCVGASQMAWRQNDVMPTIFSHTIILTHRITAPGPVILCVKIICVAKVSLQSESSILKSQTTTNQNSECWQPEPPKRITSVQQNQGTNVAPQQQQHHQRFLLTVQTTCNNKNASLKLRLCRQTIKGACINQLGFANYYRSSDLRFWITIVYYEWFQISDLSDFRFWITIVYY
jgi:hypothetical protein